MKCDKNNKGEDTHLKKSIIKSKAAYKKNKFTTVVMVCKSNSLTIATQRDIYAFTKLILVWYKAKC